VLDLHKPEIEKSKIKISWNESLSVSMLEIDSKLIEQVFINVLRNAIEAVQGVSKPQISAILNRSDEGKSIVQITDNGCGMSPEILDSIFIPFFTTKKKGSGIGLSLSKQIMKMHNGTIEVNSMEGKGSTIILRF
jgi:signal transduction histidine kinase